MEQYDMLPPREEKRQFQAIYVQWVEALHLPGISLLL